MHALPYFTDDEVADMCAGLTQPAAMARHLKRLGLRDLKGKGATDMWLSGVPIERIQLLCGHKDPATTARVYDRSKEVSRRAL